MKIISASRRTDLPRVFPEQLAEWLRQEEVSVTNPYNQKSRQVDLKPGNVHTLVLWSKDYGPLIDDVGSLRRQVEKYSQLFFQFTITGMGGSRIEPGIRPLAETTRQFPWLVKIAQDPRRINWRFDPILFWREEGSMRSNFESFERIAEKAREAGIQSVTTSFCQGYGKTIQRAKKQGLDWFAPTEEETQNYLLLLKNKAEKHEMSIKVCCNPEIMPSGVSKASCIEGKLLSELHPNKKLVSCEKDKGQRKNCGCTASIDIGSYQLRCPQGCIYCYANPK